MYAAIVFLPLIGSAIAGLFGRVIGARPSELVTTGLLFVSAALSVLAFNEVETVRHHGVDPRFGAVKLEFLTMVAEPCSDGELSVLLIFAGDMAIQLRVRKIEATLCDFGQPWPATAAPHHELAAESA